MVAAAALQLCDFGSARSAKAPTQSGLLSSPTQHNVLLSTQTLMLGSASLPGLAAYASASGADGGPAPMDAQALTGLAPPPQLQRLTGDYGVAVGEGGGMAAVARAVSGGSLDGSAPAANGSGPHGGASPHLAVMQRVSSTNQGGGGGGGGGGMPPPAPR